MHWFSILALIGVLLLAFLTGRALGRPRWSLMPLLTLGQAVAARVRLTVWCKACLHRFEPDTAEIAEQHGARMTVLAWARRLCCEQCGARDADYIVSGTKRWSSDRALNDRIARAFWSYLSFPPQGHAHAQLDDLSRLEIEGRDLVPIDFGSGYLDLRSRSNALQNRFYRLISRNRRRPK
jgi:hypothetical protein